MSSSTNPKPVIKQSQGSKAAIIRPVNRRDGKQSFVRIDSAAENVVRPNIRALQLEDYVAQIRATEPPAEAPQPKRQAAPASAPAPQPVAEELSFTTLTPTGHADVLRAVAKLDAGYQWIAESNRIAATSTPEFIDRATAVETPKTAEPQTTTQPLTQELANDIASSIASELTGKSEAELNKKVSSTILTPKEDILRLLPEVPRAGYTLPVAEHSFVARKAPQQEVKNPEPANSFSTTNTTSMTAAAWDVAGFRWPEVTGHILSLDGLLLSLAENCTAMLSPFGKTIAVTAPTRGQGTSTMAMTLSRLFAMRKKRVLLVDADITNPGLSKTVGLAGVTWFQQTNSLLPISEAIVHGKQSGICIMPLGEPISNLAANSAPVFDQLESHLDQVRSEFDLIIIDAGPVWQLVDEISSNCHLVDVAMLVNQDTQSNGFAEARERLMDRGIFKFIATQNSHAHRAA